MVKRKNRPSWQKYVFILTLILGIAIFFSHRIAVFYTDWLWHNAVGGRIVFLKVYGARLFLFSVFGTASFLLAYFNVWLADRISPPSSVSTQHQLALFTGTSGKPIGRFLEILSSLRHLLDVMLLIGAFVFAILAGLSAQAEWNTFLRFTHPETFGIRDPHFGKDIGYFVFTLPFLHFVQGWSLTITLLIATGVTLVYLYQQGINRAAGNMVVLPHVRSHLSIIVGLAFLLLAWGNILDRYYLLISDTAQSSVNYTDIYVRLPYLYVLFTTSLVCATISFINIWRRTLYLPVVSVVVWAVMSGVGFVWPTIYDRLYVIANEARLEVPFISRTLTATRQGYHLTGLRLVDWPQEQRPTAPIQTDSALLAHFPAWDEDPLKQVLTAQQSFRRFAVLSPPRTDRYLVDGKMTTVQLAARDTVPQKVDPRAFNWPNLHLRYTHGYGAVAAVGNNKEGNPEYLLSGLPPQTRIPSLALKEPRVYFGYSADVNDYAVINTRLSEMDFGVTSNPKEEGYRYTGTAGIRLTPLARLAFAFRFGALSLLLSGDLNAESRLILARNATYRLKRLAPFLLLDSTAYPVIADGHIVWLQSAFTTASTYPYSPVLTSGDRWSDAVAYNYIRSSVLATVDSFTGEVKLYVEDEADPIIRSYRRIFPTMFHSAAEMPMVIRQHRHYPLTLFQAQQRILAEYHTEQPATFYSRTDVWRVPKYELNPPGSTTTGVTNREATPYFATTRLLNESTPEFVLLSPFTPQDKTNLTALLVARCDPAHYGELLLYRFGSDTPSPGPEQMDRRARTDTRLAAYTEQMRNLGVPDFGEMRVYPIDNRLYYVQAVYVRPMGAQDPDSLAPPSAQLRRVIVATPGALGLGPTTVDAFTTLLPPSVLVQQGGTSFTSPSSALINQAVTHYERGQAALRAGDFARYGQESQALGEVLHTLQAAPSAPYHPTETKPPKPR